MNFSGSAWTAATLAVTDLRSKEGPEWMSSAPRCRALVAAHVHLTRDDVAISFLEEPLQFRAPDATLRIGLGIGRIVFRPQHRGSGTDDGCGQRSNHASAGGSRGRVSRLAGTTRGDSTGGHQTIESCPDQRPRLPPHRGHVAISCTRPRSSVIPYPHTAVTGKGDRWCAARV